jgi:hypothetical protein
MDINIVNSFDNLKEKGENRNNEKTTRGICKILRSLYHSSRIDLLPNGHGRKILEYRIDENDQ